jgi:3-oxoacyl-[acyl-carrier protein] reductase
MDEQDAHESPTSPLRNKVALVTGSARGIGRAIAIALAADGADVVVNDLTAGEESDETLRHIERRGRRGIAVAADVSRYPDVERLVDRAIAEFGRIDILVNNACRGPGDDRWSAFTPDPETTVADMPLEWWHQTLDNCLGSAFYCARAVVPHMIRAGRGG